MKALLAAEGTGVEPATGKPAPDFESVAECRNPREKQACCGSCQHIASSDKKLPADLNAVIEGWSRLPDEVKAAILVIIRNV
jgi:hypothetical protein